MAHSRYIAIRDLPTHIEYDDAIEAVYGTELNWIWSKLEQNLSVLLECDKQLSLYLYRGIRQRCHNAVINKKLHLLSGHAMNDTDVSGAQTSLLQRLLNQIQGVVFSGEVDQIIVLNHLDILTTTTSSSLSNETREAAALLYENPESVYLAFKDPCFEIPKVIESLFTVRRSLIGISRDSIAQLITQDEARKFDLEQIDPYSMYKYFSGLNAIRVRQILSHLQQRLDYNPSHPEVLADIYRDIRSMTVFSNIELPNVSLEDDIAGYAEVKQQISQEILTLLQRKETLESPEQIKAIEALIPKGIIFHGPPGTGKTFFAKAIATALNATIFIVSGPELKSKWVGESEENLRRIFFQAHQSAPSVIVFDELDSFAASRGTYTGSGVEHSMVNQLLTEMDGFRSDELVFVIGTTNFVESLDAALLRPGRFELTIEIPYPQDEDRKAILELYKNKMTLNIDDATIDYAVQRTSGYADATHRLHYSGDHLYALMRYLKREELRQDKIGEPIHKQEIDQAIGKKKNRISLSQEEERTIAIHEAGHAILAYVLPHCPTIEKITIAADDNEILGYVLQAVKKNKYITTEAELLDDICVLLGGRLAEILILNNASLGAYSDLQRATEIARMMVEDMGMSKSIGLRTFSAQGEQSAINQGRREISESSANLIDQEISSLLTQQAQRADQLLLQYKNELNQLISSLEKNKSVDLPELKTIFNGSDFKEAHGKHNH